MQRRRPSPLTSPTYQRSPTIQLVLPNSSHPVDFPDIPVLKYPPFRIGIIPGNLVAFGPTDTARITTIECDHTSIPMPALPGLLDSCADVFRIHLPQLPKRLGIIDWFLWRTMVHVQREYERKLALCKLARPAESYTLLYCFRKKERGCRWTSIEELRRACGLRTANASLTSSWIQESVSFARTVTMMLRIVDGRTMKMGILTTTAPGARYPRVSVFDFISGHGDHPSSSPTSRPVKESHCNGSAPPVRRHGQRPLSHQFSCCCHQESSVFGHCYLQDATSMASSHAEGGQEAAPPERRDGNAEASAVMGDWG
jgi:hypothetical protein